MHVLFLVCEAAWLYKTIFPVRYGSHSFLYLHIFRWINNDNKMSL